MGKDTVDGRTKGTLDRLGVVVDLDAEPQDALEYIFSHSKHRGRLWRPHLVDFKSEPLFRYQVYLFMLSTLARRWLSEGISCRGAVTLSDCDPVSFPLPGAKGTRYGLMVRHMYDVQRPKSKRRKGKYTSIPRLLKERVPRLLEACRKGGKTRYHSGIYLPEWAKLDTFCFWRSADFTRLIPQPSTEREVDLSALDSVSCPIHAEDLLDLHNRILDAEFWQKWEERGDPQSIARVKGRAGLAKRRRLARTRSEPEVRSIGDSQGVGTTPTSGCRSLGPAWKDSEGEVEFLRGLQDSEKPGTARSSTVLVAVSPSYRNEVRSAEYYLVRRLGLDAPTFEAVAAQSEIEQLEKEGHAICRLPHFMPADVWEEHGETHGDRKDMSDGDNFLYRYVTADTPNKLDVVTNLDRDTRQRLLFRVSRDGKLASVVDREPSLMRVAKWLWLSPVVDDELLSVVDKKMREYDDPQAFGRCIRAIYRLDPRKGKRFLDRMLKDQLPAHLSRGADVGGFGSAVGSVLQVDREAAREMCEQIPLGELANTFLRTPSGFDMFWCVLWITRANPAIGLRLSRSLEPLMLQFQMSEACADKAVRHQPVASILQHYWEHAPQNLTEQGFGNDRAMNVDVFASVSKYAVIGRRPVPPLAPWDHHQDELGDLGAVRDVYRRDKAFLRFWWKGVTARYSSRSFVQCYLPRSIIPEIPVGKTYYALNQRVSPVPNPDELWWTVFAGSEVEHGNLRCA